MIAGLRGVLLDIDGTLLAGDRAIPGAADCLERLTARGLAWRLTTNTTRRPRSAVARVLRRAGIEVSAERILAPAVLARRRILESGRLRASLLVPAPTRVDLDGVRPVATRPDWVVVGDLGRGFSWSRLNRAFRQLRGGARLLALHKNPWWHAGDAGPTIDAGAFVAGLEYASGCEAEVVGKPSRVFFDLALELIELPAQAVLVVGDDPLNDGCGGAAAGCRTALVRTGKLAAGASAPSAYVPDLVLDSIADLLR